VRIEICGREKAAATFSKDTRERFWLTGKAAHLLGACLGPRWSPREPLSRGGLVVLGVPSAATTPAAMRSDLEQLTRCGKRTVPFLGHHWVLPARWYLLWGWSCTVRTVCTNSRYRTVQYNSRLSSEHQPATNTLDSLASMLSSCSVAHTARTVALGWLWGRPWQRISARHARWKPNEDHMSAASPSTHASTRRSMWLLPTSYSSVLPPQLIRKQSNKPTNHLTAAKKTRARGGKVQFIAGISLLPRVSKMASAARVCVHVCASRTRCLQSLCSGASTFLYWCILMAGNASLFVSPRPSVELSRSRLRPRLKLRVCAGDHPL
jgi:hypothetical protein